MKAKLGLAAAVAGTICGTAAIISFVVVGLFPTREHMVHAALLGMMFRMALPLAAAMAAPSRRAVSCHVSQRTWTGRTSISPARPRGAASSRAARVGLFRCWSSSCCRIEVTLTAWTRAEYRS